MGGGPFAPDSVEGFPLGSEGARAGVGPMGELILPGDEGSGWMRLFRRWPTGLAVLQVIPALYVIVGAGETDFAAGIAAMACIYLAAYAVGSQVAAWPAYPAVIAVLVAVELVGIDARITMAGLLLLLWIAAVFRGRMRDGRWFALQTAGMVFFGGLTLLTLPLEVQAVGVIAGIGFFTHGLWDAYHFARNRVVNRPWSEMCVVVDLILGPVLIAVALTQ